MLVCIYACMYACKYVQYYWYAFKYVQYAFMSVCIWAAAAATAGVVDGGARGLA